MPAGRKLIRTLTLIQRSELKKPKREEDLSMGKRKQLGDDRIVSDVMSAQWSPELFRSLKRQTIKCKPAMFN